MFLHHYNGSWSWNISPTVRWNLRGVCYRLTADGKYPVQHCGNFTLPIQCNYLKNEMAFHNFLFHYLNLHQILNILKKRCISKFTDREELSKKRRFGTRFDSQHVKASQILVKSPWECFYFVFSSFSLKLIWKMSRLVWAEILGVFVNISTPDDKYPVQDCENLPVPIHMQISQNRKTICEFFNYISEICVKF